MDSATVMGLDYETQLFAFHPRTFLDRIYNIFYENLFGILNELKNHLSIEYNHIAPVSSINSSTDELFQQLLKKLDKAIDKLELYIDSNIFNIPSHVILPEDEIHLTNPSTKEEDEELNKEIKELKQRILEERMRKIILKPKLNEQKYVKEALAAYKDKLIGIKDVVCQIKGNQEDLQQTVAKCWEMLNIMEKPGKI